MKRLVVLAVTGLIIGGSLGFADKSNRASDSYVRDRVVMLAGKEGTCSGIQVKAPSGKVYIVTAAHCDILLSNNKVVAIMEDNSKAVVQFVDIDRKNDLMVLTSPNKKSVDMAEKTYMYQKVHTMTHGAGHRTYRTDGELLEEKDLDIPAFPIDSKEDERKCKRQHGKVMLAMGLFPICVKTQHDAITTAKAVPGSSGGALLNESGELVGIVSNTDGMFTGVVPLRFIKEILMKR